MPVMNVEPLQYEEAPIVQNDILVLPPFVRGYPLSAIKQMENTRNRYYAVAADQGLVPSQAHHIARTNPPVKAATSPVTLSAAGFGNTYRLSDEALRQYSLGTYLRNMAQTYYQTRP